MKQYSVVYLAEAEDELVSIWENATDRTLVAEAANTADRLLASSPEQRSVYIGEDLWRIDVSLLRFYFAIREDDRLVEVSNVIVVAN